MEVREAIDTIGHARLAVLSGVARATIDRTRIRNAVSLTAAGRRVRQAIIDQGIDLADGAMDDGSQPDLPMEAPTDLRLRRAQMAKAEADAAEKQRKNAEAEGRLLPADEVAAKVGHAGAQLRTGIDGGRRRIEALLCEGCRDVIVAEYDGTMRTTIDAVLKALEG